jgi:two-component system, chemotaxis family, protein-glutamate methylesterase/glutaminase
MACRDVVVVGASAGGVAALQMLVAGLPRDFPASVLVVLHLSPHTPSLLHEVLARVSALPVTAAKDGEVMAPGHVYVATADRHLVIQPEGRMRMTRGPRENRSRPAVDTLFRSAAYFSGPRVIGIVLSGTLDDGTAGLWAIKDRGGLALVQSPDDAQYPSMPQSALRHVAVDYTLPVADMPALLSNLVRQELETLVSPAPAEAMLTEVRIAMEGNGLQAGVMQLGLVSPNTCPECHGVLVRLQEGVNVRYRCHTGHAYSLETLLADVNEEIDTTLWAALRALEERILLLQELSEAAHSRGEGESELELLERATVTGRRAQVIRELVLEHGDIDGAARRS